MTRKDSYGFRCAEPRAQETTQCSPKNENAEREDGQHEKKSGKSGTSGRVALSGVALRDLDSLRLKDRQPTAISLQFKRIQNPNNLFGLFLTFYLARQK